MKFALSFLFGIIPLFVWAIQYKKSKEEGRFSLFKKHWACYKGDFIFVFIGFLFPFSVVLKSSFFILLVISFLFNLLIHRFWAEKNKKRISESHFFYKNSTKLSFSGFVHLIFSTIYTAIIFSILLLEPVKPYIFFEIFFLFLFGIIMIISSYKIHSKVDRTDFLIASILIISVFLKMLKIVFNY